MSQEQLGATAGLTFQQIQKYEKGVNRISASRLYEFSQALGCPVTFFYTDLPSDIATADDQGKHGLGDRITDLLASREGVTLIEAFSRIAEPHVRKAIVRLVSEMANGKNSSSSA